MEKSKEELSEIAHKAVETRKSKVHATQMLCPMLELIKDGNLYHLNDLELPLAEEFSLTEEELTETISSGQKRFFYRMAWTKSFLKLAELIITLEQAKFKISPFGLKFLKENPNFKEKDLEKIPSWNEKYGKKKIKKEQKINKDNSLENKVKNELLDKIKEASPDFFERLVVILLEKMGYGDGKTTKKSHDGGIDGL